MANYEFNFEDSNEEYTGVEVVDPVLETKPEQTVQVVELEENEGFIYVDLEEDENIVIDSESAFPAMGDANDELKHSLLTGRDLHDQHPVTAITGLREELNIIESLKTEYSDKRQVADYYQWKDTNYYKENRVGYFVTVCEDVNTIEICDGTNVFGVTIDNAGFVGGQDDIARDISYGLVAHNGIVHVRCETDVTTGDYIISNQYGMAKKNGENYGFKVIGIEWVNGVKFAIVALNLSVDQIDAIGENISNFNSRLDGVETNILSAINLANEAYNKSIEASNNAGTAIDTSNNVNNNLEDISSKVDENDRLVQEAIETAIQAQTIANSTVATAETLRQEAVEAANEALAETIKTKNEVSETIEKIQTDVENSKLDIESAFENLDELKEDLEPLDSWTSDDGKESGIVGFVARANEDSSTLATLAEWKGEASNSIAGVIQTADANKASLDILAGFEYGNDYSLYPYVNSPKDENKPLNPINGIEFSDNGEGVITATGTASGDADFIIAQNLVLSKGKYGMTGCAQNGSETTYYIIVKQTKKDGSVLEFKDIGLYQDTETEEYSEIECKFEIEDGDIISTWIRIISGTKVNNLTFKPCLKQYYMGISGLRNQVSKNGSSIDLLTSFSSDNGEGVAGLIAKVSGHDATLNSIATWQTDTTNAIAGVSSKADTNAASITSLTSWKNSTIESIAGIQQKANDQAATIEILSAFDTDISNNIASIKQNADADGASIRLLVANMDKYSVGEYSPAYGFTLEQAREILKDGVVYVPVYEDGSKTKTEKYGTKTYNFIQGNYYTWIEEAGTWIEKSNAIHFSDIMPSETTYLYWYNTNSSKGTSGYEPYTLYQLEKYTQDGVSSNRGIAVASLKGGVSNRAISQIRQDANSISAEITNAKGSSTSLSQRLSDTDAKVQTVANWQNTTGSSLSTFMNNASKNFASAAQIAQVVDSKGNITSASIMTIVKNNISSVNISADQITMTGNTTFIRPSDLSASGTTIIDGSRIKTGLIESHNYEYGKTGMSIDVYNGIIYSKNFSVNADGDASIKGTITADSGLIAGFNIGTGSRAYPTGKVLFKTVINKTDNKTQYEVGMKATSGETDLAFYVWKTTNEWKTKNYTFCIRNNGGLYATNAEISGKITSSSGTIGGWTIANGYLTSKVGSTNKHMYLSSGNQSADSWIKTYDSNGDTTFKITKEGVMHAAGAVISGKITASSGNFANGVTIGGSSITAGDLRKLFRAARLGYNDADSLQILRVDATSGKIGGWSINSDSIHGSSSYGNVTISPTNLYVGEGTGGGSVRWYFVYGAAKIYQNQYSDKRLKTNIESLSDQYEQLFDTLQPKRYKYIDGTSNRYHTGFIAQEVMDSVNNAGLTSQDFAAACLEGINAKEEGYWQLRRDEFVALNTWQIQKAKARITELEEKVAKLEKLINDK